MLKCDVSRGVIEEYLELIRKWQKKINLISRNDNKHIWERHVMDSLQVLQFIEDKDVHLIDLGTGAGFPGLVLSLAGIKKVTLIDSNSKKCAFLLQAAKLSKNELVIINDKVENISIEGDILTSRACSKLNQIFSLTAGLKITKKYLILKGINYEAELIEAKKYWNFNYNLHGSKTISGGKVIEITNLTSNV